MSGTAFLDGRVTLWAGDCLDVLARLPENSVDAVCTDPPYHLTSIVKRFGAEGAAEAKAGATGAYQRASSGFMGKQWDGGDIAFQPATWAAVLRVLKPGGHMVAFSGTRTYHRMVCAIEDAGFEIRDSLMWHYGSGFPKSHNVAKVLDAKKERCSCDVPVRNMRRVVDACDPLSGDAEQDVLACLPGKANLHPQFGTPSAQRSALATGVPAMRGAVQDFAGVAEAERECLLQPVLPGEGARRAPHPVFEQHEGADARAAVGREEPGMEGRRNSAPTEGELRLGEICSLSAAPEIDGADGWLRDGASAGDGRVDRSAAAESGMRPSCGPRTAQQSENQLGTVAGQPEPQNGGAWPHCGRCGKPIVPDGLGTALKPATELIALARKPISEKSIAANVLQHGTGAINIGACRVGDTKRVPGGISQQKPNASVYGKYGIETGTEGGHDPNLGRWPANLIHDGSDEVLAAFPESESKAGLRGEHSDIRGDNYNRSEGATISGSNSVRGHTDSGSAARFFYSAKADAEDRLGSKHPTVKPLDLMQYLCRLVTPPGGTILDPFAGTGTTGEAAWREGFKAILIEREAEYLADIARRMELAVLPTKRAAVAKTKNNLMGAEGTPLFGFEDEARQGKARQGAGLSTANSHGTDNRPDRTQAMNEAAE